MMRASGRNKLRGTVTEVRLDGLLAQIELQVGDNHVVALITREGAEELDLKIGDTATALIKATEVMIVKDN